MTINQKNTKSVSDNSTSAPPAQNTFTPVDVDDYKAEVDEKRRAKEINQAIIAKQKLLDGCLEMDRITREIISPTILHAATLVDQLEILMEVIELETESPLDLRIYALGMRFRFGDKKLPTKIAFEADPEAHTFRLQLRVLEADEVDEIIPFHAVTPPKVQSILKSVFTEALPDVAYEPTVLEDKFDPSAFQAPFRVQMEDKGKTSDIATTDTLEEAIKMGSTFSSIYKKNNTLCILDAKDQVIC